MNDLPSQYCSYCVRVTLISFEGTQLFHLQELYCRWNSPRNPGELHNEVIILTSYNTYLQKMYNITKLQISNWYEALLGGGGLNNP